MSGVGSAVAAGVIAAGGIASAVIGASGTESAASTQAAGEEEAAGTQEQMFNTIVGQEQPYLTSGYGAQNALNYLLGTGTVGGTVGSGASAMALPGASSLASSTGLPAGYLTQTFNPTLAQLTSYPGYQFQLDQGNAATQNANAPGLGALSGAAQEGLSQFNQGLAASNYQNYFNQFQTQQNNIFTRLSQIASLGQNAAGNLGNTGAQLGTGIASAQAAAAGSQAAGTVGATNAVTGAINSSSIPLAYLLGGQPSSFSPANYSSMSGAAIANQIGYPASIT